MKPFIICFAFISSTYASFFEVQYPSVLVTAERYGNITIEAGPSGGNILMRPGKNGTVFIGHTDILKLFEVVNSLPPIWGEKSAHGSLGTFLGGSKIAVYLEAQDPEGTRLRFEKISGALPPGVIIDPDTGFVSGVAPDIDASYEFGVRVSDTHGKYADQTFSIDTREKDQCINNPCRNGGSCQDLIDNYRCTCLRGYGGRSCEYNCSSTAVGVANNATNKIPDAQLSAHISSSDRAGVNGRLYDSSGWIGEGSNSWLQVDIGAVSDVYAVETQGAISSYYVNQYTITDSVDGNNFNAVMAGNSTMYFASSGSSFNSVNRQTFPMPIRARYVRFYPSNWTSATKPGMRVEIYACRVDN